MEAKGSVIQKLITSKPNPCDFGFGDNSLQKTYDLIEAERNNIKVKCIIFLFILFTLLLSIITFQFENITNLSKFLSTFILIALGSSFLIIMSSLVLFPLLVGFFNFIINKKYPKYVEYESSLKAYNYWQLREQLEFWHNLSGLNFEKELAKIFEIAGYRVVLTKGSGDKGVDIFLNKDNCSTIVQCKNHKSPVGPAIAREIYGTLIASNANKAILASINGFTKGVYEFCRDKNVELWDIEKIIEFKKSLIVT